MLKAASQRLYRLIVAAIETGCRQGELLSLQWEDVSLERRELRIRAEKAKDREDRYIPISTRLHTVLEMTQYDPAGHRFDGEHFVFGDEVGRRIASPKKTWETAVLKAHGHKPAWAKRGSHRLLPDSQDAYRKIDLHFHDLRHEAGNRWLEKGMPLHHVKELLGHASISTTDTYLNAGRIHLQDSMRRLDQAMSSGKSGTNVAQQGATEQPLVRQPPEDTGGKLLIN